MTRHEFEKAAVGLVCVIRDLLHEYDPEARQLSIGIVDVNILIHAPDDGKTVDVLSNDDGIVKSWNRKDRDGTNLDVVLGVIDNEG